MEVCPFCNGLASTSYTCPQCVEVLQDCGKTVDYLDNYSPYLDQQILQEVDGLPHAESNTYCVHIFYCPACRIEYEMKIHVI